MAEPLFDRDAESFFGALHHLFGDVEVEYVAQHFLAGLPFAFVVDGEGPGKFYYVFVQHGDSGF